MPTIRAPATPKIRHQATFHDGLQQTHDAFHVSPGEERKGFQKVVFEL
jgi:hypothetical protein